MAQRRVSVRPESVHALGGDLAPDEETQPQQRGELLRGLAGPLQHGELQHDERVGQDLRVPVSVAKAPSVKW